MKQTSIPTLVTHRGVVYPWNCDSMGHLTTRYYMGMFDDACLHFLHALGHIIGMHEGRRVGWADVNHDIAYQREFGDGNLVIIHSWPQAVGGKSLRYTQQMRHADTGEVHCTQTAVSVQFDLDAREAIPLLPGVRERAVQWLGGTVPARADQSGTGLLETVQKR